MPERGSSSRQSLLAIARLIARYRGRFLAGIGFLIIVDALQLFNPRIIRYAVDGLTSGTATLRTLWVAGLAYLGVQVSVGVLRFGWRYFITGTGYLVERDLRARLYRHLQTLPLQFYTHTKAGTVISYATNDVPSVRLATGMALLGAADATFMILSCTTLMFFIDWELTLWILLPVPLLAVTMRVFGQRMHRQFLRVQDAFSKLSDRASECFSSIRVVKAYGNEATEARQFDAVARRQMAENLRMARLDSQFNPLITLLTSCSVILMLVVGGRRVLTGEITLGGFVAMSFYVGMLVWPMMAIGWVINLVQRGGASMERLLSVFDEPPSAMDGPHGQIADTSLEVRDLTFTYPGAAAPALQDLSFRLPAGGTLGLIGRTGAGKSTLAELFLRLYEPPRGTVWLGGHDVTDLKLPALHQTIGYVPQDSFLFAMSIAENIAFGNEQLEAAQIEAAARRAHIHDEILAFPEGYRTRVGERGVTLSGGQKQRIAIARVLASRPPVLIFDDCLSAVDTETEAAILRELKQEMAGRTTILISHRVSTVRHASLILVLDGGRVVERGTHEDLLLLNGYYTRLYRLQKLEGLQVDDDAPPAGPGAPGAA